jgi:hypothetical protein
VDLWSDFDRAGSPSAEIQLPTSPPWKINQVDPKLAIDKCDDITTADMQEWFLSRAMPVMICQTKKLAMTGALF